MAEDEVETKWPLRWRVLKQIQSYCVEIAYFTFFLSRHMTLPLFQEYVQSQVNKTHQLGGQHLHRNSTVANAEARQETVINILSLQIAEGLPAVVSVIILGAVSDRTGRRKILLWLPSLGSCAYSLIYVLVQYTGWSIDALFMASALRGLSGSMTAFFAGSSYYAINSVRIENRSSRLALQEFLNGLAYAIGNLMVGFWVKSSGFVQPFWFTLIFAFISLLISSFLVSELPNSEEQNHRTPARISYRQHRASSGNCCNDTFKPMLKFFSCKDPDLRKMWVAIIAFQSYALIHIGQENTLILYLSGLPINWKDDVGKIGVFLSLVVGCAAFGTLITPPVLRSRFSDTNIVFLGFLSKAVGTLWIAVVQKEAILYAAILLLAFELLPFPMFRAIVSKGVAPADQGSLFALMHCSESIIYFVAPLMFQAIYASSFKYYSGFVFVLSVILLLVPIGATIGVRYLESKGSQEYLQMEGDTELIPPSRSSSQTALVPERSVQPEDANDPQNQFRTLQPISFIDLRGDPV